jgi:hypothetical protein
MNSSRVVADGASTQVLPMPRRGCESLPATPTFQHASARQAAVWFCEDNREPLMISMPSTQGMSEAMCGAVISPLMREATLQHCARYFAADDLVGTVGDCQRTVHAIVVGNRDQIHPASLGSPVHTFRRVVGLLHEQLHEPSLGRRRSTSLGGTTHRI